MKTVTKEKKTVPTAKKAVAVKSAVKKAIEKSAAKAAPVKKAAAKPAAKAAPVKKAAAKPAAKAAPVKKAAAKPAAKAAPVKKIVVKTVSAKTVKQASVRKVVAPVEESVEPKTLHKKLKLNKTQKQHYIDILLKLRSEFMDQMKFHSDDALASKKDAAGERAGMATHMADLGSDNFRHDVELGLLSDEGDVIIMIDEALQRIKDSEFGICTECGCQIPEARLEAKPYARFCTKCKSLHEQQDDPLKHHR